MSVKPGDIRIYGSANMSTAEGTTQGGAASFSTKVDFTDLASTQAVNYVSSSASDTATTITATGRDATGVIQQETKTLNGTTPVSGSQSFQRLLAGSVGGATAVGDVAIISSTAVVLAHTAQTGSANSTGTTPALMKLQSGDGAARVLGEIIRTTGGTGPSQLREIIGLPAVYGTDIVAVNRDWGTIPDTTTTYNIHDGVLFQLSPNQITKAQRPFYNASADVLGGATRFFYEKLFMVNDNTATALTVAQVLKETDPSGGTLDFALCSSLNDTATVANRQTAPASGITAFSSGSAPQTINVPSPQNLPSGAAPNSAGAQGIWLRLTLTAGQAPQNTNFDLRGTGSTV